MFGSKMAKGMAATTVVGAALLATGFTGAVQAQPAYAPYGYAQPAYAGPGRPLTVQRHYAPAPVVVTPAYDPYYGPKALITAPVAVAATLVALPFRMVNAVFPAHGDVGQNPLVMVGAPVHAAGQIAQLPFRAIQAPFGGADYYPEY